MSKSKILFYFSSIFFVISAITAAFAGSMTIHNLRCEYRTNPLGMDVPQPRLSWELQADERGQKQTAYRILVATSQEKLDENIGDAWDSGWVASDQSVQVSYAGSPLQSDRPYFWKVRVRDKDGVESDWSESAFWLTGLLHESDWQAKWIGLDKAVGDDDPNAEHRRLAARMLRREFNVNKKIKRATAFVCGLGLFELYINGRKIGDQVLAPALSEYNKRSYYMTFDVTKNLRSAENAVGVILGNGRYFAPRGENPTKTKTYGFPKLLLQINIHYEDGTVDRIVSDETWKLTAEGPIRANNEYDGEVYDARKEMPGWAEPGFDDSDWRPVEMVEKPGEKIVAQPSEPIKVMETLRPISISQPKPGMYIFDMGQNMVGWVQLHVKGERGTRVQLRFAEVLKDDGTLYLDNIRSAEVTDVYILKGGGQAETWQPRFTYHGFRYVELTGYPGTPDLDTIEGKVVHDALRTTGQFSCSNPLINRIYKNATWGIRGNYRSIPTDCPQRDERQGWLGDRSAESRGESYIFDVAAFYNKWLVDIQDAQLQNGSLPNVAPSYWPTYSDNTTWPGSYIIIPSMLYDQYQDMETLKRHYPSMKKWIEHMSQYVQDDLMPRDTYGDWCVPPEDPKLIHSSDPKRITSGEFIGTAYFYHELKLMERFAILLNRADDADYFAGFAERMKAAFNEKFLSKSTMKYSNNTQTVNVLALAFDLVPEEYRARIFDNLVEKIMGENEGHIGTGLIGAQWLMRVLTENGRPDIAYLLASQKSYPSWGYMAEQGATTIWELWNGDTGDPAMNSHNHVMLLGDLITWLYEDLAGIKTDPEQAGFKHIIMRPHVVYGLDWVKASYQSLRGLISSQWRIKSGKFYWDVLIPANTTATVYIPAEKESDVSEGNGLASDSEGVEFLGMNNGRAIYRVQSGRYSFVSRRFRMQKTAPYVSTPFTSPGDTTIALPGKIDIRLFCRTPGADIRYTLDGSEPTKDSPLYQKPITVSKATRLKVRAFKADWHPSSTKTIYVDFVDPQKNGVRYELYRGAFKQLPDFSSLTPVRTGRAIKMDLDALKVPNSNFALIFTGFVKILQQGEYTFYINSNDGSQLFIDDKLLIDNDGEHGPTEKSSKIQLSQGLHAIRVTYFQSGGSQLLKTAYKGPNMEKQIIPGSMLFLQAEK